jgi:hypothetical protein
VPVTSALGFFLAFSGIGTYGRFSRAVPQFEEAALNLFPHADKALHL